MDMTIMDASYLEERLKTALLKGQLVSTIVDSLTVRLMLLASWHSARSRCATSLSRRDLQEDETLTCGH